MYRTYDKYKDKAVMFYSAASPKDAQQVLDAGANEILVSYHYLRKRKKVFTEDIMTQIKNNDGVFMTDSGAFSFAVSALKSATLEEQKREEYWLPYLEEYVQFLHDYQKYIYVAANLDLDNIVGRDIVDKWNDRYFKPLEKSLNICYVVQKDVNNVYQDFEGLKRLNEYFKEYEYIAVNAWMKKHSSLIKSRAKILNKRVHGLAWTHKEVLDDCVFSIDSSTWLMGQRFGTTYKYDGKNFKTLDLKQKWRRKNYKLEIQSNPSLNYEGIVGDVSKDVTLFNAIQWKGFRDEFVKRANVKLINKPVAFYEKSCRKE